LGKDDCPVGTLPKNEMNCLDLLKGPYVITGKNNFELTGNIDLPALFADNPECDPHFVPGGALFRVEDGAEIDCNGFSITGVSSIAPVEMMEYIFDQSYAGDFLHTAFEVNGKAKFKNCDISDFVVGINILNGGFSKGGKDVFIEYTKFFNIWDAAIFVGTRPQQSLGAVSLPDPQPATIDMKLEVLDSLFEDSGAGILYYLPGAAGAVKVHRSTFSGLEAGVAAINFDPESQIDLDITHVTFSNVMFAVLNSFHTTTIPNKKAKTVVEDVLIRGMNRVGIRVDYGDLDTRRLNVRRNHYSYGSPTRRALASLVPKEELEDQHKSRRRLMYADDGMSVSMILDMLPSSLVANCKDSMLEATYDDYRFDMYLGCAEALGSVSIEKSGFCGGNPTNLDAREAAVDAKHYSMFVPEKAQVNIKKASTLICQDILTSVGFSGEREINPVEFCTGSCSAPPAVTSCAANSGQAMTPPRISLIPAKAIDVCGASLSGNTVYGLTADVGSEGITIECLSGNGLIVPAGSTLFCNGVTISSNDGLGIGIELLGNAKIVGCAVESFDTNFKISGSGGAILKGLTSKNATSQGILVNSANTGGPAKILEFASDIDAIGISISGGSTLDLEVENPTIIDFESAAIHNSGTGHLQVSGGTMEGSSKDTSHGIVHKGKGVVKTTVSGVAISGTRFAFNTFDLEGSLTLDVKGVTLKDNIVGIHLFDNLGSNTVKATVSCTVIEGTEEEGIFVALLNKASSFTSTDSLVSGSAGSNIEIWGQTPENIVTLSNSKFCGGNGLDIVDARQGDPKAIFQSVACKEVRRNKETTVCGQACVDGGGPEVLPLTCSA
jgi:hypothetical protein